MKVSEERFVFEYQHYIQQYDNRHIEWYVDINNDLNLFIITDKGFAYHHSCNSNNIPEKIKQLISKKGEILGFWKEKPADISNPDNFSNIKKINQIIYSDRGA